MFHQEKLISYLSLHNIVGVEIFEYVAKRIYIGNGSMREFDTVVPIMFRGDWESNIKPEEEENYINAARFEPEDIDTFIRRIPFNFYHDGKYINDKGEAKIWHPVAINDLLYCIGNEPFSMLHYHRQIPLTLEDAYTKLELLFYEKGYSLQEIFSYTSSIVGSVC